MSERYGNNFTTVLAAPMLIGDGTAAVSVAAPAALQGGQFRIAIESELMLVTAGETTTTWTVTRGIEGTTPAAHAAGATVVHVLTAAGLLAIVPAGVAISALPAATAANSADQMLVNQGGVSKNITLGLVRSYSWVVMKMAGLVSYWRLGESTGTVARDAMGVNTGTFAQTPTLGARGLLSGDPDNAISMTGTDNTGGYVLVKNTSILSGLTNSSVVVWMAMTGTPINYKSLYCERGAGNDICDFAAQLTAGRPRFVYRDDAGTLDQIDSTSGTFLNNGTHMFAVVKSGTAITMYVDGVSNKTGTLTASDTFTGSVESRIGGNAGAANAFFPGSLDEVAIFNRALTGAEVAYLYAVGTA